MNMLTVCGDPVNEAVSLSEAIYNSKENVEKKKPKKNQKLKHNLDADKKSVIIFA